MVQDEIRIGLFSLTIAPVVEEHAAVTFTREKLQKLLRHHLIRINIHAIERCDQPGVLRKRLHSSVISVIPLRSL